MKPTVSVEINAEVRVSKATAEACLKLVELYANQNSKLVAGQRNEDGTVSFEFINDRGVDDDY